MAAHQILKPFMNLLIQLLLLQLAIQSCNFISADSKYPTELVNQSEENPYKQIKAIPLPAGFFRTQADSFAAYLRSIGLKSDKTVYLYNGIPKPNQKAQFALLNISTGNKDLQQCADAVMRLRAEYLYQQKSFDEIVFYDNDKTAYRFLPPHTRERFTIYLQRVFAMCGSASLAKQLKTADKFETIQPGDVIIRGGFPGHAVIVMDVAQNTAGEKIYMLAQSYMPAQDIHVLVNPADADWSPWYKVNNNHIIETPEYSFTKNELKRW